LAADPWLRRSSNIGHTCECQRELRHIGKNFSSFGAERWRVTIDIAAVIKTWGGQPAADLASAGQRVAASAGSVIRR
jgi:hypothetical protein